VLEGVLWHYFERHLPVQAQVRQGDHRAEQLRSLGAEVMVADFPKPDQVFLIPQGCEKVFFCRSVSANYLEATMVMAAAAKAATGIHLLFNMSQMTGIEIDLTQTTDSHQQRLQWMSEQRLNWCGLPVTHLRPTMFQGNTIFWNLPALEIMRSAILRMPFERGRSSPVAANDAAEVAVQILLHLDQYVGKSVELTGPSSVDMFKLVKNYSTATGSPVQYAPTQFNT
jgi:uncharacterized protein YbjT (DUF2867 family)